MQALHIITVGILAKPVLSHETVAGLMMELSGLGLCVQYATTEPQRNPQSNVATSL